ncbi:MAG: ATP-binding protein, partial [Planctomycetota bacterium]
ASAEISKGNYNINIPATRSTDEIARLLATFSAMAKELGEYHKDMEGKIQDAREKIQATEAQLIVAQRLSATGTLAAGIAHEINNPLGGILNAAHSLKKGDLPKEQTRQYLELIIDGLLRIQDTLKKILQSFSHRASPQPLDLKIVIERAISLVRHRIDESKIAISNTLPLHIPQVFGDATELQQVFLNLLMNAVDAVNARTAPPDGRAGKHDKKIEIFHESDDKNIMVCLRDSGVGMNSEELSRAFDMFFTTKEPGKGTGLGLTVAYNIVQNHNGKIDITSDKNKGTTVKVSLPVIRKKMEDALRPVKRDSGTL